MRCVSRAARLPATPHVLVASLAVSISVFEAFARYRELTDEQRVLVCGRGADSRRLEAWRALLDDLVGFERARRGGVRQAASAAVVLVVLAGALFGVGVVRPDVVGGSALSWLGALAAALAVVAAAVASVLKGRAVESHVERVTLPFLRSLEQEVGRDATLYLSLRTDGARPTHGDDVRWLEGAVALGDGTLLHFGGRDVLEPSGPRAWLRATWSRPSEEIQPHVVGEDDPSVSGLTRRVAEEARREGNPFTSMEMIALREAHGVKLQLLRLEAFEEQRVPPPPVGDVLGEQSRGVAGGRASADVNAAALLSLARAARDRRAV